MNSTARDFSEKRDFIRMQVSTPTRIEVDGKTCDGVCVDLSSSGVSIQTIHSFEVNSKVILEIQSGGGNTSPLKVEATILRVSKQPEGDYLYGAGIERFL